MITTHNVNVRPTAKNLARRSISLRAEFVDYVQPTDIVNINVEAGFASTTINTSGEALKAKVEKCETKTGKSFYVFRY